MNDEQASVVNPIGLYRDPESGQYVGSLDPIQSDAMVHMGFVLHSEGREAAMSTQAQIDALKAPKEPVSNDGGSADDSKTKKEGK